LKSSSIVLRREFRRVESNFAREKLFRSLDPIGHCTQFTWQMAIEFASPLLYSRARQMTGKCFIRVHEGLPVRDVIEEIIERFTGELRRFRLLSLKHLPLLLSVEQFFRLSKVLLGDMRVFSSTQPETHEPLLCIPLECRVEVLEGRVLTAVEYRLTIVRAARALY
jgi:hypothetical protein